MKAKDKEKLKKSNLILFFTGMLLTFGISRLFSKIQDLVKHCETSPFLNGSQLHLGYESFEDAEDKAQIKPLL